MRNLAQLQKECEKHGLTVKRAGKREAKSDYEAALREFYWNRDYPGQKMIPQLHPMLARNLKDVDPEVADMMWHNQSSWVAQEKIDGCRLLMHIGSGLNRFTSRRLSDKTYRYSENTDQIPHLAKLDLPRLVGTVLDGEVICPKAVINTGSVTTLNGLQATTALLALNAKDSVRVQEEQDCRLIFKVFDILYYNGQDVMGRPLEWRLTRLSTVMSEIQLVCEERGIQCLIEMVPTFGLGKKEFYEKVVSEGGEGIMLKDLGATYEPSSSRTKAMYKVKRFEEVDAFVTGAKPGDPGAGWEKLIGGLEVSCYVEHLTGINFETHPVAWVSNMTLAERIEATCCANCCTQMKVDTENRAGKVIITKVICPKCENEEAIVLNPEWIDRVYVVRGQEFTSRVNRLKHAVIVSRRFDKEPRDCKIDLSAIEAKFAGKAEETGLRL